MSSKNLSGCITYRPSRVFNGVSAYSLQGSVSSSCETVRVGLFFARQTSIGVKPRVGCTDRVHDDEWFSSEVCLSGKINVRQFFQRCYSVGDICEGRWNARLLQKCKILINKFYTPFLTLDKFLKCTVVMHNRSGIYSLFCYRRKV